MFPETMFEGNIETRGKTKLFPKGTDIKIGLRTEIYFSAFQ